MHASVAIVFVSKRPRLLLSDSFLTLCYYFSIADFEDQTRELNRMLEQELKLPVPSSNAQTKNSFSQSGAGTGTGLSTNRNISSAHNTTGDMDASTSALDNHSFERIQNFEEAFNKIRAATGITDIEELVRYVTLRIWLNYCYCYLYLFLLLTCIGRL